MAAGPRPNSLMVGAGLVSILDCKCFDQPGDLAIDSADLVDFIKCATGPGVTWTLEATPGCAP